MGIFQPAMFVYRRVANEGLAWDPPKNVMSYFLVTGMGGDYKGVGSWHINSVYPLWVKL